VLFGRNGSLRGKISYDVNKAEECLHIVVGTPKDREVRLKIGGKEKRLRTTKEGVLSFRTTDVQQTKIIIDFEDDT